MNTIRTEFIVNSVEDLAKYHEVMGNIASDNGTVVKIMDGDMWIDTPAASVYVTAAELRGNYIGRMADYERYWSVLVAQTAKAIRIEF